MTAQGEEVMLEMTAADKAREAVLGPELYKRVRGARLLVVGAGGIGCELVKDLVMAGFEDLEVVDLDTIDVSNLNRQFLFRAHHVGQPKAVVAREAVLAFNPRARIVAHHDNIKAPQFGLDYYKVRGEMDGWIGFGAGDIAEMSDGAIEEIEERLSVSRPLPVDPDPPT